MIINISTPFPEVAERFKSRAQKEWANRLPLGELGFIFMGYFRPGEASATWMGYTTEEGPTFDIVDPFSQRCSFLLLDIAQEVAPAGAQEAAAIATFRDADESWRIFVAYGEDADYWSFTVGNCDRIAREVSPV